MSVLPLILVSLALAQTEESRELRQILEQQRAAWNRGDLEAFMRTYWNSPDLTFFSGDTIIKGWTATLERYRARYQAGGQDMGQLSFSDQRVEMLGTAAATVTARWHLAFRDGQKREGLTTVICRKTDRGWKIVHDHSS